MNELLPCPFCGGEPEMTQIGKDRVQIKCSGCYVEKTSKVLRYSIEWLKETMTKWWNQRATVYTAPKPESGHEKLYDDTNPDYIKNTEDGI